MRRADTEGPKACVTLSTCQGSASPGQKKRERETGTLSWGKGETSGSGFHGMLTVNEQHLGGPRCPAAIVGVGLCHSLDQG